MKKKHLRRQIAALQAEAQQQVARISTQLANVSTDREGIAQHLAEAGFVRVEGFRTDADRERAAAAGVIVLADVILVSAPEYRVESPEPPAFYRESGSLRLPVMPAEHSLKLEITAPPEILRLIREALAKRF